jgi:tetratricopeptide (TPR) repeat protein
MRANVLPDVRRGKRAGRFVWLAVDTEQERNAGFLEKFPIGSWPTFLVIDPKDESVLVKWLGSARAGDLEKLLAGAERARGRSSTGAEAILARADRAYGAGRVDEAVAAYREALAQGGPRWEGRARAVESLVLALASSRRDEACADEARRAAPSLPRGPSFANSASIGLSCAVGAPAGAPWRAAALGALLPLAEEALPLPGLLADDRSGLFDAVAEARAARGDAAGASETARAWWRFLDAERSRARTAEERAALDGQRVTAALRLGEPALAVPALQASQRELPDDYNPPARLALLYREMGRLAEARAAVERALHLAYGPRKLKVYDLAASILDKQGDRAALAATLSEAVAYAGRLPRAQRDETLVRRLEARLAAAER